MVQKLIFNENATEQEIDFDFTLRGYKSIPNQNTICVMKYATPGNPTLHKEIFIHYSQTKHHFWCWLEDNECERFLCSRNVDYDQTVNKVVNMSTQTD